MMNIHCTSVFTNAACAFMPLANTKTQSSNLIGLWRDQIRRLLVSRKTNVIHPTHVMCNTAAAGKTFCSRHVHHVAMCYHNRALSLYELGRKAAAAADLELALEQPVILHRDETAMLLASINREQEGVLALLLCLLTDIATIDVLTLLKYSCSGPEPRTLLITSLTWFFSCSFASISPRGSCPSLPGRAKTL